MNSRSNSNKEISLLPGISAPAQRALDAAGISTLKQLSGYTEKEILKLHGMGKSGIPKLRAALNAKGLDFKPET